MSRRYFGTDGVRGVANADLTPEFCLKLGAAAGRLIRARGLTPRVVVGRDTRRSGPMLGAALAAGLCAEGVDVEAIGIAPTGAISYYARTHGYGLGVVISASHNPAPDNGIKFLAADGRKVTDQDEGEMEADLESVPTARPVGEAVGRLTTVTNALGDYTDWLVGLVPERLDGMRLMVDCAHGAAYAVATSVFERLGAETSPLGQSPNGMNINADGGATKPHVMQSATAAGGFDLGIAFDGDADRAVFSDGQGRLMNGDRTMAVWAEHWRDQMHVPVVVGTVMSNGGFAAYLEAQGMRLERAPVGDKHVAQRITETGAAIGGEQSGHIIFPAQGPTGDGLVTALELLRVLRRSGTSAEEFYDRFANWPQRLVNLRVGSKEAFLASTAVQEAVRVAAGRLGAAGRVNVRPSGTQPMVRLMVEATDGGLADQVLQDLEQVIVAAVGGEVVGRVDLTYALGD